MISTRMYSWVLFSAIVLVAQCEAMSTFEKRQLTEENPSIFSEKPENNDKWKDFKKKFNKHYADISEELKRENIFKANLQVIEKHNDLYNKGLTTFKMGVNPFADLEHTEFLKLRTGLIPLKNRNFSSENSYNQHSRLTKSKRALDVKDWRTEGYVSPVKDQGQCGSCWAFSATGAVESLYFNKIGVKMTLSEQDLIDCDKRNFGCGGGVVQWAFDHIKDRGINPEAQYPYVARDTRRTSFYDEVGVIRDMMQSHMTEVLTLVAMETPDKNAKIQAILNNKHQLLGDIMPLDVTSTVIGQYETYATEVQIEGNKTDYLSRMPTFAASVVNINNARWRGVPFILTSGKKLDEKTSYIKVVFKDANFCMSKIVSKCKEDTGYVIFVLGDGNLKASGMVAVSKSLGEMKPTFGWKLDETSSKETLFGVKSDQLNRFIPEFKQSDAYSVLIEAVFEGQRHLFTNTKNVIRSWDIWSELAKKLDHSTPRKYLGDYHDIDILDLKVSGYKMNFLKHDENAMFEHMDDVFDHDKKNVAQMSQIPSEFRGSKIVVKKQEDLIKMLAETIEAVAIKAITERGVFHLALPGGSTPRPLLSYIVYNMAMFPWKHTHIWQVDERCVPTQSKNSNFKMIQELLLSFVHIPYVNIHPMPVHLLEELCDAKYNGDLLYEALIKHHTTNQTLDFVLLGIGDDGHIASLFPEQDESAIPSNKLVAYVEVKGRPVTSPKRMTMTFKLLNSARHVALVAIGKSKHTILTSLSQLHTDTNLSYPVTKINPANGEIVWYIDFPAYFG